VRKVLNEKGYIYVFTDGEYYKIGHTKYNPTIRLMQCQCGNPRRMEIVDCFFVNNTVHIEQQLHDILKKKRVRPQGEWFDLDESDIDMIYKFIDKPPETLDTETPIIELDSIQLAWC